MTIDEARGYLRLCNSANNHMHDHGHWASELWLGYAHKLCGNCCHECTTMETLQAVFPELAGYDTEAERNEWKEGSDARE